MRKASLSLHEGGEKNTKREQNDKKQEEETILGLYQPPNQREGGLRAVRDPRERGSSSSSSSTISSTEVVRGLEGVESEDADSG